MSAHPALELLMLKHQAIGIPCWLNIHCNRLVSYRNITVISNHIREWNHMLKKKLKNTQSLTGLRVKTKSQTSHDRDDDYWTSQWHIINHNVNRGMWLMAPSNYLNQCWLIISKVQWPSSTCNVTQDSSAINQWNQLANHFRVPTDRPWKIFQWYFKTKIRNFHDNFKCHKT